MKIRLNAIFIILSVIISALSIVCCAATKNKLAINQPVNHIADADSTEAQRRIRHIIEERYHLARGRNLNMVINPDGLLVSIAGDIINEGLTSNDPVERTYQFLEINRDILYLENPRNELHLRLVDRAENGSGVVKFDQMVNGVKMEGGFYRGNFILRPNGSLRFDELSGALYPAARNINTNPSISSEQAQAIALAAPINQGRDPAPSVAISPELSIRGYPDGLHLVWSFEVWNGGYCGGDNYFIDAHTGQILFAGCGILKN